MSNNEPVLLNLTGGLALYKSRLAYCFIIMPILFFFLTSLLEYNCFAMVCFCFITKWISYTYTCPLISSLLRLPPSHPPYPTPLGGHRAWADLPVLCGCFPLASYVTFGSVYMSVPLSHFVPAYPIMPFLKRVILIKNLYSPVALW